MKFNLCFGYNEKVCVPLISSNDLKDIDLETTNYENSNDLINNSKYSEKIKEFKYRTFAYAGKIKNPKDKEGHLLIVFNNPLYREIDIYYKKDRDKLDASKSFTKCNSYILSIRNNDNACPVLFNIFEKMGSLLKTESFKRDGHFRDLKNLQNSTCVYIGNERSYEFLRKYLRHFILKAPTEQKKYYYIRLLRYILKNNGLSDNLVSIANNNINKNKKATLVKNNIKTNIIEEEIDTVPITPIINYEEVENQIEIDDFAIEEKDDPRTWKM